MRKQCVPGSFLSAHALEPGNEASFSPASSPPHNVTHVAVLGRNQTVVYFNHITMFKAL